LTMVSRVMVMVAPVWLRGDSSYWLLVTGF
jgi:hypothetical protein